MTQVRSASESQGVQAMEPDQIVPGSADVFPKPSLTFAKTLTSREASILAMIVEGSTNRETAKVLGISPRWSSFIAPTANIMQKIGAKNAADLMRILFSNVMHGAIFGNLSTICIGLFIEYLDTNSSTKFVCPDIYQRGKNRISV